MLENTNGSTGTSPARPTVLQLRVAGALGQPPLSNWARVPSGLSCYMTSNSLSKSSPRTNDRLNEVPSLHASEASLGGLDRCVRLGPVEPKKWQALPEATLAARTHDFVAALNTRAAALVAERPLAELCGLPTEQSDMEPLNNQPSMEQPKRPPASGSSQPSMERQQMAPSAPWSAKRPPAAMPAPVAVEAPSTPPAPRRVRTTTAPRPGAGQGGMGSAGADSRSARARPGESAPASGVEWHVDTVAVHAVYIRFAKHQLPASIPPIPTHPTPS